MGYRTYTCPIARQCGGCEWLAVPYPIQLERKRAELQRLVDEELPRERLEVAEVLGMDQPLHYRHKAATPFAPAPKHRIRHGFYARGSHHIVRCDDCLVEARGMRRTLAAVAEEAARLGISAYAEDQGRGLLRHAILRAGWQTNEALLTLVVNGNAIPRADQLVQAVRTRARKAGVNIVSVVHNINQRNTNAMLGSRSKTLFGKGRMRDRLLGCTFELGPTSFYQTNPEQTEVLYDTAIQAAGLSAGMRVIDAYCGIGTIGLCAARQVEGLELLGIERVEEAVACAQRNARLNGLEGQARFIAADATEWMVRHAADAGTAADVVFLDPPRAGSTPEFLDAVCGLRPERVVYVSCNPVTLVRDLAYLRERGWHADSLVPVDLFPHTKHVETVVLMSRKDT